jgi:hypothetical protein
MAMVVLKDSVVSSPSFPIVSTYLISYSIYEQSCNIAKLPTRTETMHKDVQRS